jgi:hypothetical protein
MTFATAFVDCLDGGSNAANRSHLLSASVCNPYYLLLLLLTNSQGSGYTTDMAWLISKALVVPLPSPNTLSSIANSTQDANKQASIPASSHPTPQTKADVNEGQTAPAARSQPTDGTACSLHSTHSTHSTQLAYAQATDEQQRTPADLLSSSQPLPLQFTQLCTQADAAQDHQHSTVGEYGDLRSGQADVKAVQRMVRAILTTLFTNRLGHTAAATLVDLLTVGCLFQLYGL